MKDATKAITEVYSLEELKEIANHGCQSGVCTKHVYYGDTIKFYDTYEVQILDDLVLNYGYDLLIDLFKENNANLTWYKNAVVWAFIELVAFEEVDHYYEPSMQPAWFSHGGISSFPKRFIYLFNPPTQFNYG